MLFAKKFQPGRRHWCAALFVMSAVAMTAKEAPSKAAPTPAATSLEITFLEKDTVAPGTSLILHGPSVRRQLIVTAHLHNNATADFTSKVTYKASPANIVGVDKAGSLTPLRDGRATVLVKAANGVTTKLDVMVEAFADEKPVSFVNQVVPIFTKTGCNGGGCHGKSGGQNGFRLSLLGFEPKEDFEFLVKEGRGRRLFPAAPDNSLLLLKGAAILPHGGGKRLEPGSDDYKLLARWIGQGMPYGSTNDASVARVEVFPKASKLTMSGEQQLIVVAHYTDGTAADVTRSALYEPNDKNMARAEESGRVQMFDQPGDVAVMVRYQGQVSVYRATVPLGAPVESLPPARNLVDELVFAKLKDIGMPPSPVCDDATFIRRVTLDITGRLPTPEESTRFLADKSPAKRDQLINALLDSPDYAEYFAQTWSALLRNKRTQGNHIRGTYAFHDWIRDSFLENKPFDRFAREILAASGEVIENPPVAWYRQVRETQAQMEDTAQLFLGTRLQCAQCHHHPYERWSQQDYYSFSAFFSQVGRKAGAQPGEEMIFVRRTMPSATNKKTKQAVEPAGLGSPPVKLSADDDARFALADWMSRPDNPFFAKSLVNRYWKHFFSRGLVEPEDDIRATNPAVNPELLDGLSAQFIKSGFDLKGLIRTICQSTTYQLSALPNEYNKVDRQNFSRYYPKRLRAEVLLDAVNTMAKSDGRWDNLPVGTRAVALPDNSFNASSYFLTVFGRPESSSACECERSQDASLAQSLHLLNAKDIQDKLATDTGRAAQLAADTTHSPDDKLQDLYLWAYSRTPSADEQGLAKKYLSRTVKDKDGKDTPVNQRQAYEDLIWAMINTKEFLFNH